jgi:hypothetical protein
MYVSYVQGRVSLFVMSEFTSAATERESSKT